MGLIGKDTSKEELLFAVETVNSGLIYFGQDWNEDKVMTLSKQLASSYKNNISRIGPECLTLKEKNILRLIVEGKTSNQIALELNLGKRTVDSYRSNIIQKLDVRTVAELISYGLKHYEELFEVED
jgi:DNA-binding NarL/FixJ family response regulator